MVLSAPWDFPVCARVVPRCAYGREITHGSKPCTESSRQTRMSRLQDSTGRLSSIPRQMEIRRARRDGKRVRTVDFFRWNDVTAASSTPPTTCGAGSEYEKTVIGPLSMQIYCLMSCGHYHPRATATAARRSCSM